MSFLHPMLAAVGLGAIALPIIIHLLIRRRVKPVRWAAMKFLLEAYKQRRRRLILEQILLLATRCLLVACIAIALGRLLIGAGAGSGLGSDARPTSLILVIDDSLTSGADGALERHKAEAARLLGQLNPGAGDTAALVTLSRPSEGVVLPATSDVGALRGFVERLTPTDAGADLTGAVEAINRASGAVGSGAVSGSDDAASGPRVVVAVLSEFLAGSVDLQASLGAIVPEPHLVLMTGPRSEGVDNVGIAGVEPLRSVVTGGRSLAASNQVRVTLRRSGPGVGGATTRGVRVTTAREGGGPETLGQATARFEPGQQEATVIMQADVGPPESGARASRVIAASIDDDALPRDNVVRRVIEFRDSIRVAVVAPRRFQQQDAGAGLDRFDAADWVTLALEPVMSGESASGARADIETSRVEPSAITSARLAGFDAIALCAPQSLDQTGWEAIGAFLGQGGLLVVVPPAEVSVHLWADQLSALNLGWTIGREARELDPAQPIDASTTLSAGADLLALVRAELPELSRSVGVRRVLPLTLDAERREQPALVLADGSVLMASGVPGGADGRGLVVMFAASLDLAWTDLPAKPLVVPLVQEVVRQGVGVARGVWHTSAGSRPSLPAGTTELRSVGGDSGAGGAGMDPEPASSTTIAIDGRASGDNGSGGGSPPLRRAGVYRAVDAQGTTRAWISIAPDPRASDTSAMAPEAVRAWVSTIAPGVRVTELSGVEGQGGSPSGPGEATLSSALGSVANTRDRSFGFLVAALTLALVELALARWSSHARAFTSNEGRVDAQPATRGAAA